MTSIKDVARLAGVSVTTVSYVLNNRGAIKPQTRQRVQQVIEELGYTRSIQARNLRDQQARIIGSGWRAQFNPEATNPLLDSFVQQVMVLLEAQGLHLMVFNDPEDNSLGVHTELIKSRRVDGFILAHTNLDDQRVRLLAESNIPFVAFGKSGSELDNLTSWVDIDSETGIFMVTEHLIQQGHQRIGAIGWPPGSMVGDARFQGYQRALSQYGLPFENEWERRCKNLIGDSYLATEALLNLPTPPTAIVCFSDMMAIGAIRYTQEYRLPVAVTGFDDIPAAAYITPPLTSLRQPISTVAELLVDMLVNQLQGNRKPQSHLLPPELIIRASSLISPKESIP